MPPSFSKHSFVSLDQAALAARDRLHKQLLYYFSQALPDLDYNGEAVVNMQELTDLIVEAAALRALQIQYEQCPHS